MLVSISEPLGVYALCIISIRRQVDASVAHLYQFLQDLDSLYSDFYHTLVNSEEDPYIKRYNIYTYPDHYMSHRFIHLTTLITI